MSCCSARTLEVAFGSGEQAAQRAAVANAAPMDFRGCVQADGTNAFPRIDVSFDL
jgi:hypothetical protein